MRYLSCFSGIGGLEASHPPILFCESDPAVHGVLRTTNPSVQIWPDIRTLQPPPADVVAGGWPCQDISIAGRQAGLKGLRSGLLLEMLRVARQANAHTVVAENVTNLLRMRGGEEFSASLDAFQSSGFRYVAWRLLNAREFGLPQNRSRLLLVASQEERVALTLFRRVTPLPKSVTAPDLRKKAAGFYWTGGTHSINYSRGYVPTIKVGSGLNIASPPAVHYDDVVRTISPREALALQGFEVDPGLFRSAAAAYRAAGNAVARPIGRWVLDGLNEPGQTTAPEWIPSQTELWAELKSRREYPNAGMSIEGTVIGARVAHSPGATNLYEFLDRSSKDRLSVRARRGLLERLRRSGQACPLELRVLLEARVE